MSATKSTPALTGTDLRKAFRRDNGETAQALAGVSFAAQHGTLTALVGPDGAGKTTLLRLAAGLMRADSGELKVLGVDVAADPYQIQSRIGYMPQRFGLYEDLTVQENLDLYADLHGVSRADRRERYPQLMDMTKLGPFTRRLAGQLSGGMKQKLGLACTLIRSPELLLLDEPTVGVDPISRLELWQIILQLVREAGQTVVLSTSYLDEAERCGQVLVLHAGHVLAQGPPGETSARAAGRTFVITPPTSQTARGVQARLLNQPGVVDAVPEGGKVRLVGAVDRIDHTLSLTDIEPVQPRFEDGFMVLLRGAEVGVPSGGRLEGSTPASNHGLTDSVPKPLSPGTPGERGWGEGAELQGKTLVSCGSTPSPPTPLPRSTGGEGSLTDPHPWSTGVEGSSTSADSGNRSSNVSEGGTPTDSAVVQVENLVRKFGKFTAVDHVSFEVKRGEIFGLLGPNGAGKTTTFRMLCGLLAATEGTLHVAGVDLRRARASARQLIGYVAQKFSLYGQLSVLENLEFFASAYSLRGQRKRQRIDWAMKQFELAPMAGLPSGQLPGGYKQRLAMAAALLHEPDILFLDEPTSGADPLARREFWQRITGLAEQGVTVIVTTHFMEEAEYCDHVVIMDAGQVLARGTPAEVRSHARPEPGRTPTMEDAFIAIVQKGRTAQEDQGGMTKDEKDRPEMKHAAAVRSSSSLIPHPSSLSSSFQLKLLRIWSLIRKEYKQIVRDPSAIAVGVVMPILLIVLFGHGLSLDVKDVPIAVVLEQPTPQALEVAARFQLSPYFDARLLTSMNEAERLLLLGKVDGIVRIRPDFSRKMELADAEVQIVVQGADANRARIIEGYAQGAVAEWAALKITRGQLVAAGPVGVRDRVWFNEANDSHYFLVPGLVVLVMTLIGAMLTALVVAREWERGTLEAMFVTPVRAGEILLGKTVPYFVLGMFGLALCLFASRFFFGVPFRGSVLVLAGVSMLYLLVALSVGLLISSATKSQFVSIQLTMLVTFLPAMMLSGFLFDLRSMPAAVRVISYALPARYYVSLLQTIFLCGNVWSLILFNAAVLAGMAGVLLVQTRWVTHKRLD